MIGTFKLPIVPLPESSGDYLVRFIDYDGTILKEQYVNSGQSATAPNLPTHSLLTFDEWNNDFSNITGDLDVGATYRTTTGHSYLFLSFTVPHRLTPSLYLNKSTTDVLNVYDNASGALLGTSSESGTVTINLTFAAVGDYVIRIECAGIYKTQSYVFGNGLNYELVLRKVFIGDSVTSIGKLTFRNCYSLQSIVIPAGVTEIGTQAFQTCYSLQSIVIPAGVTAITTSTFNGCYSLQSIVIPAGVTEIGTQAFQTCYSLQSIVIPAGVTAITTSTFNGCYSLQSIVIPAGVTEIGTSTFNGCYSLQSIVIPAGVIALGGTQAFQNCYSLQSIVIPAGVTVINSYAFSGCYSLQSIVIPAGVTVINSYAFSGCYSLQSIVIPTGLITLSGTAFQNCYSLQSIVISAGVTTIDAYTFYNCTKMQEYIFEPTTPPTLANTNAFTGIIAVCKIYVPDASVDAYKGATNWATYASYIYPISTRP